MLLSAPTNICLLEPEGVVKFNFILGRVSIGVFSFFEETFVFINIEFPELSLMKARWLFLKFRVPPSMVVTVPNIEGSVAASTKNPCATGIYLFGVFVPSLPSFMPNELSATATTLLIKE
ncbi:hypothetical protein D3C80_1643120 [compost metagenome]